MKKIIATLVILLLVVSGAYLIKKRRNQISSLPPPINKEMTIQVVMPDNRHIEEKRQFLGTYYSIHHPGICSKLTGLIKKVYVKEGQEVTKGDLLITIDDKEIRQSIISQKAELRALKYSIGALESSLSSLRADYEYARGIYKRNKALYKVGAISREKLQNSRVIMKLKASRLKATLKEISSKKNQLKALKAQLLSKEHLLTYTSLCSPLDGEVGKIFLREGDMAVPGKPILILYGKEKRVEFSFPLSLVHKIRPGEKAYIMGKQAKITAIMPRASHSLGVAYIDLPFPLPLPDMSNVPVEVVIREATGTCVPISALLTRGDGTFIFSYKKENFLPIKVKVLARNELFAIISPSIDTEVAMGSSDKLSRLFEVKRAIGVRDE